MGRFDLVNSKAYPKVHLFLVIRYAIVIVADLDTPAAQCMRTLPP